MPFKFEGLHIWQKAFDLADEIHHLALSFPHIEKFSLSVQIKKAADSVVLNIAEGSTGMTNPEQKRFLNMSLRSAFEVVSCLMLAKRREYIGEDLFSKLYEEYDRLCRMITRFRDALS